LAANVLVVRFDKTFENLVCIEGHFLPGKKRSKSFQGMQMTSFRCMINASSSGVNCCPNLLAKGRILDKSVGQANLC